jgi:excisionase family DNA binding protein
MRSDDFESLRGLPLPQLVTPAQAASYLGISQYTVRQRLRDGSLRGKKLGGQWTILVEDLVAYVTPTDDA